MLIICGFIVIVVAAIVISSAIAKKKSAEAEAEAAAEAEAEDAYVITDEALALNAIPEINTLMRTYYDAVAAGDVDTIMSIKTSVDEKEKIVVEKKSEIVESYPTVDVYTKPGPEENSYVVFANYEVKFFDYEENVPGINAWYVCVREDGSYYINDDELDDELEEYCKLITVQDDVIDLDNQVTVQYNEILEADEELAAFLDTLPDVLTAAVGEELAKADAPEDEETEETEEETEEETTVTNAKGTTTDVVNIRMSDSENADKVGKAQKGDVYTVLEQKANGWTKIEYEGTEAYIKSQYIQVESEESESADTEEDTQNKDDSTDTEAAAASPDSGTATAKDTINVRAKASVDADKVAVCYKGEQVTVIEKQSDGWSKVKYAGKTGYVKSEYLE